MGVCYSALGMMASAYLHRPSGLVPLSYPYHIGVSPASPELNGTGVLTFYLDERKLSRVVPGSAQMYRWQQESESWVPAGGQFYAERTLVSGRISPLGRRGGGGQVSVARHRQRFAQGQRRQAMAVQVARWVHQAAVGRLLFDQVPQAPGNLVTVLALQLRMAGAQQSQQHHARRAVQGIRVRPGGTALAAHAGVLAQLLVETPRTVVALMADQPLQGEFHRVFAFGGCPLRQSLSPAVAAPRQAAPRVLAHRESRIPARLGFRSRDLDCQLPRNLLQFGQYHPRVRMVPQQRTEG